MNIYKIYVEHYSQKDSHDYVETFILAESDEQVYDWIDKLQHGLYSDRDKEDGLCDIYDEDYNKIGEESYKEKMIRIRGEYFDTDLELDDLYYGKTLYGWEKMKSTDISAETEVLNRFGMLTV